MMIEVVGGKVGFTFLELCKVFFSINEEAVAVW